MKWLRRNWFRLIFLVVAALAAFPWADYLPLGTWVPETEKAILPRLSPLLNVFGALAAREWVGWSLLLGVPLAVLAFFKGRIFCWRMCPMGFVAECASKLNPWGKGLLKRVPSVNKLLALLIVVSAVFGYPLAIWLDPLCIFNGFFAAWRLPLAGVSFVTAIGFVTILLLSIAVPNIWCHRLCPLGGLQEAIMAWARRFQRAGGVPPAEAPKVLSGQVARRTLLAAAPMAAASLVLKKGFGTNAAGGIRPPGADLTRFNALCARCGNCMTACPYKLIQPDLGETGLDGLFAPVLHLRSTCGHPDDMDYYCMHDCTKCSQVCPTGALKPLTVLQKHATPIGVAVIDRTKCIAWKSSALAEGAEGRSDCAVCDEYCPYKAVKIETRNGINCPVIDEAKCRGCGACEAGCPGDPIAVRIRPLRKDEIGKVLVPSEIDSPEAASKGIYVESEGGAAGEAE